MSEPQILRFPAFEDMSRRAAELIAEEARRAVGERGVFSIALSGGSTPGRTYELLAEKRDEVPWDSVRVCWGDDRCVPPDSPDSNYRLAFEKLLSRVPVPQANIFRMKSEADDHDWAAREYEDMLRREFGEGERGVPSIDLLLMGMGPDGHTASLFPGHPLLEERGRLVAAVNEPAGSPPVPRLTMTLPLLNAGRQAMFLIAGQEKARLLTRILAGDELPAGMVRPRERLLWLVSP